MVLWFIDDKNYVILIKKGIFGSSFYSYNSMEVSLYPLRSVKRKVGEWKLRVKEFKIYSYKAKIKSEKIQNGYLKNFKFILKLKVWIKVCFLL